MNCDKLNDQLAALHQWDDTIRAKSFYKLKKDKLDAVIAALDRYEVRISEVPNGGQELEKTYSNENNNDEGEDDEDMLDD